MSESKVLAVVEIGDKYGHVPGHSYHDVEVTISVRSGRYRCHVLETWGSCQGCDEEHGRREIVGRGHTIEQCAREARGLAQEAGVKTEYLVQALSQAQDEAEDAEVEAETMDTDA